MEFYSGCSKSIMGKKEEEGTITIVWAGDVTYSNQGSDRRTNHPPPSVDLIASESQVQCRTSTMRYSLLLLLVTSIITFSVLKLLHGTLFPYFVMNLSLVLLTVVLADLLVKLAANVLPRKLLPDLENKAVFITGCDTGFGNQCARRLDALGVTVYAGCLMPEGAGAQELKKETSSRLHIVPLDVTKEKDVDKAVEYVKAIQGNQGLWAVINNAGILMTGEVELMPVEIFQRIIEVNTIGSVRVTKAFLPLVRKSKGRLVFTASCAGRLNLKEIYLHLHGDEWGNHSGINCYQYSPPGSNHNMSVIGILIYRESDGLDHAAIGGGRSTVPGLVPYSMSKHAIVSFVDGLRREMRKWSVTVHGIEPMMYRTQLTDMESYRKFLKQQWSELPEEVRRLYGDSYIEKYMKADPSIAMHRSKWRMDCYASFQMAYGLSVNTEKPVDVNCCNSHTDSCHNVLGPLIE
uniref:Uncharacterized protein n=1 Tax=Timema poppense TaxID=170557 RepID=A0A7R9GZ27_TIMPO|nr:unnamed protein product [Timema poppensis]